jgi:hypothetical protein
MKQMPDTMTCEVFANVHIVTIRYFLDCSSDLIQRHSWLTNSNSLIHSFLGYFSNLQLYRIFRLPVEDCQIVISVITIYVGCDINVYLVAKV